MPGESLSFNITADDRASSKFRDVGRAALDSSAKMDVAAASLKLWNDTASRQQKSTDTLIKSKLAAAKADAALQKAESFVSGEAGKLTRLMSGQSRTFDDVAKTAAKAAGQNGLGALIGGGGLQGGGMGALIGAGVALAPVIATVGVGLAGFGAAAAGVAAPILKAAHASGGLQANMAKLDPEQQKVARGLLSLGQRFDVFEKALKPQVLGVFNEGIQLAGHLLHDVEPVAAATGKALGTLLGQIDAEFASGTWQKFFTWMGTQAGPDIRLVGDAFINLTDALPGLLKALQPVSIELLHQVDVAAVLIRDLSQLGDTTTTAGHAAATAAKSHNILADAFRNALQFMAPELPLSQKIQHWLLKQGDAAAHSAQGLNAAGHAAVVAGPPFFNLNKAVGVLNKSMTTLVGNLLTLQGDNVSWRQSMQAAKKQLDSNSAGLAGNSKNALANKQAIIASTQAAITFAGEQLTLHRNLGQASNTIQAQIRFLQGLHDKSQFTKNEIAALRHEEELLNRQRINQTVNVHGLGEWSVSQSLAPGAGHRRAAGGMIPGTGNSDNYPALLTPGEVVVPKGMVRAGAVDHLRGTLPGFASGGLVPSYAGSPGGLGPWIQHNDAATIRLMDEAIVRATTAGIRAAQSAAQTFAGGLGRASLRQIEDWWIGAGGPGGGIAHVAAAITGAESGFNPRIVQQGQPYATTGWGLWQITPGNSEPQAGIDQQLLTGPTNAVAAVAKYRQAGNSFSPWTTFESGAYLQFMDRGGWLRPGLNHVYNGTGRPEMVVPGRGGGGTATVVLEVRSGGAPADALVAEMIRRYVRVRGGNVQAVFGRN